MAYFQVNQILSAQDINEIKQFWAANTRPAGIETGEIWLDISSTPLLLKRYNGTTDDVIAIAGPGILRKDIDDTFGGTLASTKTSGVAMKFDNGAVFFTIHDGYGNFNIKSSVNENHQIINSTGGCLIRLDETGTIILAISTKTVGQTFTNDQYIQIDSNGVVVNGKPVLRGDYPNTSKISSQIISNKSITNTSYENTGIPAGTVGTFILKNVTDGVGGFFDLCCSGPTSIDPHLGNSPGTYFRCTDTAGYMCIFFYNGTLQIRNRTGATKVISAGFFSIE